MPTPTVRVLLAHPGLALRLLTPEDALPSGTLDAAVSWVHSSDLVDPTPFVIAGQVLLTTGTQFGSPGSSHPDPGLSDPHRGLSDPHRGLSLSKPDLSSGFRQAEPPAAVGSDYEGYVERLVAAGVVGLGFGADVVRETPDDLSEACVRHGIPLFEVPYRTPFIAVARYAADLVAEQAYARDTWALSAQRAVSLAALRPDGLSGTLAEFARQLGGWVALTDSAGAVQRVFPARALSASARAAVETEAKRMLRARRRAASSVAEAGTAASLQTIGASDRLLGVLAYGDTAYADQATQQVVTSVVALAGLALDQGSELRSARSTMRAVLLRALEDAESLGRALEAAAGSEDAVSAAGLAALERARSGIEASIRRSESVERFGTATSRAEDEQRGRAALPATLDDSDARARAFALLAPLTSRDPNGVLARSLLVWIEHNGVYDSAARVLGVHRHTLTGRIRSAERALGRDFGSFADRAEVWAALRSSGTVAR